MKKTVKVEYTEVSIVLQLKYNEFTEKFNFFGSIIWDFLSIHLIRTIFNPDKSLSLLPFIFQFTKRYVLLMEQHIWSFVGRHKK